LASITRRSQADRNARQTEMRVRMLAAVERLLDEGETFTEISVERLVSEANISRSTFYVYFADKGDLLQTLTQDLLGLMLAASRGWWSRIEEADYAGLRAGIGDLVETYGAHSTLMAAIVDTSAYDPGVRDGFQGMLLAGQQELAEQIVRGQEAGTVRADLDAERTAAWLAWMVEHGLHQLVRPAGEEEADALADALARILWHALYE
jgi:TetR/AcrR family transcriptional regulator, ethionamide resistance regulator